MSGVPVILRRELKGYFDTPIAYIFIAVLLGLSSFFFFFFTPFFAIGQAEMRGFFGLLPFALFLFAPAVTMRLWSEELRVGTAEILLTLPLKPYELVIGKFLASFVVLAVALFFSFGIPLGIAMLGNPDWGPIIGGYVGALLMGSFFLALGSFVSSMTSNQVVALLVGIVVGLVVVLVLSRQTVAFLGVDNPGLARFVQELGVLDHFDSFQRGVISIGDVIYFVGGTVMFLFLTAAMIRSRKL